MASPEPTFADMAKKLATMGCDQAAIAQLKPKEELLEQQPSRVKLEPPEDLQAALRMRSGLQQQRGKATKEIEKGRGSRHEASSNTA